MDYRALEQIICQGLVNTGKNEGGSLTAAFQMFDDLPTSSFSFEQELSLALIVPFFGALRGQMTFMIPWSSTGIFFPKDLGSLEGPANMTKEHVNYSLELGSRFCSSVLAAFKSKIQLPAATGQPSIIVEMAMPLMQTLAVESARRRLTVLPGRLTLGRDESVLQGYAFFCAPASKLRLAKASQQEAA